MKDLNVMIVDDNPLVLEMIAKSLRQHGTHHITQCMSGNEALICLKQNPHVDVLMLDLNMPELDGIEMLRRLNAVHFSGGILLCSGEDTRILKTAMHLTSAYGLHVLGSLTKPVHARKLYDLFDAYQPRVIADNSAAPHLELHLDELQLAIEQRQIVPYFQPKVMVHNKSLSSAEVLARWFHPQKGLILPDLFIPMAERHGLIDQLTWLIYEQAFIYLKKWHLTDPTFQLGLNLSAESLKLIDLPERLEALATAYDIPCQAIVLEITESRLVKNITIALDVLSRLRLKHFHLSIDDFGTGYSSLSQLCLFPFSEFKIDRSFVHNTVANPAASAVLESSAGLAKKLNLTIVAEGVENEADWQEAQRVGCDMVQGYFIAKPMSGDEFDHWRTQSNYRATPAA